MNKTTKIIIGIIIAIIVIGGIWYGVSKKPTNPTAKEPIKIGAILPLSGPAAYFGQVARAGLELGSEDAEKKYNVAFQIIYEDSQGNPKNALDAFKKLTTVDNVDVIVATVYGVGQVLKPEAEKNKVPLLATVVAPNFTKGTNYVIRHAPLIEDDVEIFLKFLKENNVSNSILLYQMDDYGRNFYDLVKNRMPNIVAEYFLPTDTDFRSLVSKTIAKNPEAIGIVGYTHATALIIKQLKEMGYKGLIHASIGFEFTEAFLKGASYLEGISYADLDLDENSESIKSIYQRLKEIYQQQKPSPLTTLFYDWPIIIGKVYSTYEIKNSTDFIEKIKDLKKVDCATGFCKVTPEGEIIIPLRSKIYYSSE
jgi:branched-chain amino acid transport system substrate-binding protein